MRNFINLVEAAETFNNELDHEIEVEVTEKDIDGIDGVLINMIGPDSQHENHVTRQEAEVLRDLLNTVLDGAAKEAAITESESNLRTFTMKGVSTTPPGSDVWFRLRYDDAGNLIGLEEHNHYQGGPIRNRGTWEQTFLDRVAALSPDYLEDAENFLQGIE